MFLRKIIPLVMCVLVSTSVFANKEQAENPRVKKASHAEKSDKIKQGVYYGQIEFKPATSRRQKSGTSGPSNTRKIKQKNYCKNHC